ncbi:MAG TPA: hypothetical protein VIF62_07985 [Labilithrix sp.]|jgi:hypothetical protein
MRRRLVLAYALAALGVVSPARADKLAEAEDLFRRAKALIDANKWNEACPLLQESQRLDPGTGTLLNLALCHEHVGKVASAWGEFRAVEQQARVATPPREDRVKTAREHADRLEPRLSRIRILVPNDARAPGLVVKIDGEEKREPTWGGVPVDPGSHDVEASAPGKRARSDRVKVDDEGAVVNVAIAPLEDVPKETPRATTTPQQPAGPDLESLDQYAANRARRTTGFVASGIGLATLAAGGVFGVLAIVANDDAKSCSPCIAGSNQARSSNDATDRALVFANVANVTVPLGVIGSAIGAYLVLTAGPTSVAIAPRPNGIDLRARW